MGSCGAPDEMRRRSEEELGGGEALDNTHGGSYSLLWRSFLCLVDEEPFHLSEPGTTLRRKIVFSARRFGLLHVALVQHRFAGNSGSPTTSAVSVAVACRQYHSKGSE